jgi:hypothetical protein
MRNNEMKDNQQKGLWQQGAYKLPKKTPKRKAMITQKMYIAVNPQGQACGPANEKRAFVKKALILIYQRKWSGLITPEDTSAKVWRGIKAMGYSIEKASITFRRRSTTRKGT